VPTTENFYQDITPFTDFSEALMSYNFRPVPIDWSIVVTDVVMSTVAIEQGKYKEVNAAGAAVIAAILNLAKSIQIPFIFGGDGATLLVPKSLVEKAKAALLGNQILAKKLGLDLRVGIVPVTKIYELKEDLQVAKHKVSERYNQAVFNGIGFDLAEKLIKDPQTRSQYEVKGLGNEDNVDITGFTCRWEPIPSRHEEVISLIIKVIEPKKTKIPDIYNQINQEIFRIYGSAENYNPVFFDGLNLSMKTNEISVESKLKNPENNPLSEMMSRLKILGENVYGRIFGKAGKDMSTENKRNSMIENADFRKFDGSIKMIISGNRSQGSGLENFLEKKHQQKELVYGIHVASEALVTCLVFTRNNQEVHFVDGNDGGYALAAKDLKQQLKELINS